MNVRLINIINKKVEKKINQFQFFIRGNVFQANKWLYSSFVFLTLIWV